MHLKIPYIKAGDNMTKLSDLSRRAMTFSELCGDGVVRPIEFCSAIEPLKVTCIKKLDPPYVVGKHCACTFIVHDGHEILLLESFQSIIYTFWALLYEAANADQIAALPNP